MFKWDYLKGLWFYDYQYVSFFLPCYFAFSNVIVLLCFCFSPCSVFLYSFPHLGQGFPGEGLLAFELVLSWLCVAALCLAGTSLLPLSLNISSTPVSGTVESTPAHFHTLSSCVTLLPTVNQCFLVWDVGPPFLFPCGYLYFSNLTFNFILVTYVQSLKTQLLL